MIHSTPPPPVFVKRIQLKTWLMRDEIEHNLARQVSSGKEQKEIDLAAISEAYRPGEGGQERPEQCGSEELPQEKISHAVVMLSEITAGSMHFFSSVNFLEGQSIVIEFQVPQRFAVNAQVVRCRTHSSKVRIISERETPFRVSVKFSFLKPKEQERLHNFISAINPELPAAGERQQQEEKAA